MNRVGAEWRAIRTPNTVPIHDPATGEVLAAMPLSTADEVDEAVRAASTAFLSWRRTPPGERIQPLFRLKALLDANLKDLARIITRESGKTLAESEAELKRGIENVEVATGIPSLMMGSTLEDIASGIDETMVRQPLGVVGVITPFNFPAMIPLWFLPYAVACGNTVVLKPSERTPMAMNRVCELMEEAGFPHGVINLVNGSRDTVTAIVDHPDVRAISFVGSTPVARSVYSRAAANGKRAQCQGGARNPVVILPDADMDMACRIIADAAFGCAGQRCLASSVAIAVGDAANPFSKKITESAASRTVGNGLQAGVEMGPVISSQSRVRIEGLIEQAVAGPARALIDGRGAQITGCEHGHFLKPTVLVDVDPSSDLARTEVFGPVLSVIRAGSLEEAIEIVNRSAYGNMSCLFTSSGSAARQFRHEVRTGNVGINLGVAAPMAYFPFSGWKDSFFGDLHAQGSDAIDFFTEKKVIVERWPSDWSRKF
ncbi:MAG TPA: CoA-acylating methylmalonate-semialdehyde dehydrogenase [Terriglobia bacterium]|nr:CoA-acylating methylmalonate-semialdehyde dehydrogenase [Terriglobia bacterium]